MLERLTTTAIRDLDLEEIDQTIQTVTGILEDARNDRDNLIEHALLDDRDDPDDEVMLAERTIDYWQDYQQELWAERKRREQWDRENLHAWQQGLRIPATPVPPGILREVRL